MPIINPSMKMTRKMSSAMSVTMISKEVFISRSSPFKRILSDSIPVILPQLYVAANAAASASEARFPAVLAAFCYDA